MDKKPVLKPALGKIILMHELQSERDHRCRHCNMCIDDWQESRECYARTADKVSIRIAEFLAAAFARGELANRKGFTEDEKELLVQERMELNWAKWLPAAFLAQNA